LKIANDDLTQDPKKFANLLNKCFQYVFVVEQDGDLPPFRVNLDENWSRFADIDTNDITYEITLNKMRTLNQNKACGMDMLHPFILKNCAESLAVPVTLIFKASLITSQLPIQFRSAHVTPLFKKGDK